MIEAGMVAACRNCKDAPKDCKKSEAFGWNYYDETHTVCPSLLVEDWHVEAIDAYRHYKNGLFASDGGYSDQPAIYLEIIGVVDSEVGEIEREKMEKRN